METENRDFIKLFMWGYQKHAQISLQVAAEQLFNHLDKNLNSSVFFVGVLVEDRENRHPICIEPEDNFFHVSSFSEVKQLADELIKADTESRVIHSVESAQKNHDTRVQRRAFKDAILKILKRDSAFLTKEEYFVAYPTLVEGYFVFTILCLDKEVLSKYYSLTRSKWNDRYDISRSLIESCINIFLDECSRELKDPNRGFSFIERRFDELLRDASRNLMYTVSSASRNLNGLHGLYDTCNEIASMKYEGSEGIGGLIIAPRDHRNIKMTLELKKPIQIRNHRKVRKFLELVDEDSFIISDSSLIYGLGVIKDRYNPKDENVFVVSFKNHLKWELLHDKNSLMIMEYGLPSLPSDKINREKFYKDISRLFKDIKKKQIDNLWDVTGEAIKQQHGALIIISAKAKEEAVRLESQCFPLEPVKLDSKLISQTTSIDGGVLIDENGDCYAIGVILDGVATSKGDSSRGSRYNSAVRYYEHFGSDTPLAIIVISEDGMVNFIPDLRPQIKHSLVTETINEFIEIFELENINMKEFNEKMSFFQTVSFYLTEEECKIINSTRKKIEAKFRKNSNSLTIVYEDLKPNAEMNSSYYLDE